MSCALPPTDRLALAAARTREARRALLAAACGCADCRAYLAHARPPARPPAWAAVAHAAWAITLWWCFAAVIFAAVQ